MKKIFAALLAMAMLLGAAGALAVEIGEACGDECPGHVITGTEPVSVTGGTHHITLSDVKITLLDDCAFSIASGATVYLTLEGENVLTSGYGYAGLQVSENAELTITAASTGSVTGKNSAGVNNMGTFTMHGGSVKSTGEFFEAVNNMGTFTMHSGSVTSEKGAGVNNMGTFTMHDGSVTSENSAGVGNTGTFMMHGGSVAGVGFGVISGSTSRFVISAGTITGGSGRSAVQYLIPNGVDEYGQTLSRRGTEEEITAACLAPGSYKVSGGFRQASVVVAVGAPAGDLPQTGDPSMLGAWVMLLAASALGLKKRGKKS